MNSTNYCYNYHDLPAYLIGEEPDTKLVGVVVIPAYCEESIENTMDSLSANEPVDGIVECIVLINEREEDGTVEKAINRVSYERCRRHAQQVNSSWLRFYIVLITSIPRSIAGVGTGRKLGMDEAARRINQAHGRTKTPIISLDADCTVTPNYLLTITTFFKKVQKTDLLTVHFEHRVGPGTDSWPVEQYELHLRYFINQQRRLGLPFAYQTIGSAFAVRASSYSAMGGMNNRKAGEDFYFIHKFTKRGTVRETGLCMVFPSGRSSARTPFGTGRTVNKLLESKEELKTYHPGSFTALKVFVDALPQWHQKDESSRIMRSMPEVVQQFLKAHKFESVLIRLQNNTTNPGSFSKAFFQWFDAFKVVKFVHFARDAGYSDIPVGRAVRIAGKDLGVPFSGGSAQDYLDYFRSSDRDREYDGISAMQVLWAANR